MATGSALIYDFSAMLGSSPIAGALDFQVNFPPSNALRHYPGQSWRSSTSPTLIYWKCDLGVQVTLDYVLLAGLNLDKGTLAAGYPKVHATNDGATYTDATQTEAEWIASGESLGSVTHDSLWYGKIRLSAEKTYRYFSVWWSWTAAPVEYTELGLFRVGKKTQLTYPHVGTHSVPYRDRLVSRSTKLYAGHRRRVPVGIKRETGRDLPLLYKNMAEAEWKLLEKVFKATNTLDPLFIDAYPDNGVESLIYGTFSDEGLDEAKYDSGLADVSFTIEEM